jgi:AraC-like DNA-binding protein
MPQVTPAQPLRDYVRAYYGFAEETRVRTRRQEGPGAEVVVILSFGNEWRIGDPRDQARPPARHTSFVGGLHDASVLTEHDGWSEGMQVNLTPPGAFALIGLPMHELANRTVSIEDVLGKRAGELVERLAETVAETEWPARFALLERALGERLADARLPSAGVQWAWSRLSATRGRLRVETLCEELGWSRKRLATRFRDEIGLPPKTLARLLRFEHAAELLGAGHALAETAFACGYYDQSHLTNDFREITGRTPAQYRRSADGVTFFQDNAAVAA